MRLTNIINSSFFLLLGNSQPHHREIPPNHLHHDKDRTRHEKTISHPRHTICELNGELDPMSVQPSSWNDGETIQMSNVIRCEESRQEVSDQTSDGVDGENVEGVVYTVEEEFELCGEVAAETRDETVDYCCPGGDETGARGDGLWRGVVRPWLLWEEMGLKCLPRGRKLLLSRSLLLTIFSRGGSQGHTR